MVERPICGKECEKLWKYASNVDKNLVGRPTRKFACKKCRRIILKNAKKNSNYKLR